MGSATRRARVARRFLVSIMQQHGLEAPQVLRQWADERELYGRQAFEKVEAELTERPGRRNERARLTRGSE